MKFLGLEISRSQKTADRPIEYLPTSVWRPNVPQWTEWGVAEYYKAYTRNPYLFRVVNYIATSASSVGTYFTDSKGEPLEKSDAEAFVNKPNSIMGRQQYLQQFFIHYILGGQAFGLSQDPSGQGLKPPREIYPFGSTKIAVKVPGTLTGVAGFTYKPKETDIDLNPNEVFWFCSPNPLNFWDAVPGTAAASKSIDANDAYLTYIRDLNISGGAGTQKFTPKDGVIITKDQREMLKSQWYDKTGQKLVVAPANGTFDMLGWSPKDMDSSVLADKMVRDICISYGVSPVLLGEASTFANYETARVQFYLETVLPMLDIYYGSYSLWLSNRFGDEINMVYDRDKIDALAPLRRQKWLSAKDGYQGGLITKNEAREEIGYGNVEESEDPGDQFYTAPVSSAFGAMATVTDEGKSWRINTGKGHKCGC